MFRNWPPFAQALLRALIGGLLLAGLTLFTDLKVGRPLSAAEVDAGAALFGYLVLRGGVEGGIDQAATSAPPSPTVAR